MGTDIHAKIETQMSGVWWQDASIEIGRNYDLFGLMAGVRGTDAPLFPPRGLPEDVNVQTERDAERTEGYTPSWLTIREVEKINNEFVRLYGPVPAGFLAAYGAMKGFEVGGSPEVRLVFWFDC